MKLAEGAEVLEQMASAEVTLILFRLFFAPIPARGVVDPGAVDLFVVIPVRLYFVESFAALLLDFQGMLWQRSGSLSPTCWVRV